DHRISPTPIQHALRRGMHVHVATSATHHGEQVWQRLRYQFPAPQVIRRRPERETWNRDLRRREWSRDPQGGAPHSRGKEYARGR
ncbi:MAG: hypothetical protein JOZ41_11895, partial [Chloroflexi bacterium]|nr:hypothetical protein [Chloroflexota bacterium]